MFHRNQEGANALEFALVLPILIVLIFGGINAAIAWDYRLQLNHTARETSRFAATLPDAATSATWFDEVFERVMVVGAGRLDPRDPNLVVCISVGDTTVVRQTATGSSAFSNDLTVARQQFADSGDANTGTAHCEADGLNGARVQVRIQAATDLNAVIFRISDIDLEAKGFAVYEDE